MNYTKEIQVRARYILITDISQPRYNIFCNHGGGFVTMVTFALSFWNVWICPWLGLPIVFESLILICIKLSKINLGGTDLSLVQIKFITEHSLHTFDVVGDVSSNALKINLIYLWTVLIHFSPVSHFYTPWQRFQGV